MVVGALLYWAGRALGIWAFHLASCAAAIIAPAANSLFPRACAWIGLASVGRWVAIGVPVAAHESGAFAAFAAAFALLQMGQAWTELAAVGWIERRADVWNPGT